MSAPLPEGAYRGIEWLPQRIELVSDALYYTQCAECLQAKLFDTPRERELWLKFHPHDDEVGA